MLAVLVGNADWQFDKDDSDKKVLHVVSFGVTRFRFDRYLMTTHTFLSFIVCKEGHQTDYVLHYLGLSICMQ